MSLAQTAAVTARIKTITALASKTFELVAPRDGSGKLPTAPYVVVQPSDGTNTQDRMSGPRRVSHPRFVLHIVGSSYTNAQTVYELVRDKFIDPVTHFGIPVSVAGESCKNLTWSSVQPVQVDNDVTPPVIYASGELSWDAEPV